MHTGEKFKAAVVDVQYSSILRKTVYAFDLSATFEHVLQKEAN